MKTVGGFTQVVRKLGCCGALSDGQLGSGRDELSVFRLVPNSLVMRSLSNGGDNVVSVAKSGTYGGLSKGRTITAGTWSISIKLQLMING